MMGGMLDISHEDESASAGLRGIQKIQLERQKAKAKNDHSDMLAASTGSDIMSSVLAASGELDVQTSLSGSQIISVHHGEMTALEAELMEQHQVAAESQAATKVQSIHRQRLAMREAELRRHAGKAHIIEIAEHHEGAAHAQHMVVHKAKHIEDQIFDEQVKTATKIQAIHRGNKARSSYYDKHACGKKAKEEKELEAKHKEEELAASTKIQAIFRGKQSRAAPPKALKTQEELDSIQAATGQKKK